jgi:deoxyribodipyrimidine photolyase-like uncharacterized protein
MVKLEATVFAFVSGEIKTAADRNAVNAALKTELDAVKGSEEGQKAIRQRVICAALVRLLGHKVYSAKLHQEAEAVANNNAFTTKFETKRNEKQERAYTSARKVWSRLLSALKVESEDKTAKGNKDKRKAHNNTPMPVKIVEAPAPREATLEDLADVAKDMRNHAHKIVNGKASLFKGAVRGVDASELRAAFIDAEAAFDRFLKLLEAAKAKEEKAAA